MPLLIQFSVPNWLNLLFELLSAEFMAFVRERVFGWLVASWLGVIRTQLKSFPFNCV